MKTLNSITIFILIALGFSACNNGAAPGQMLSHKKAVYNHAAKYGDYTTCISTVHEILVLDPAKENWKDTLAVLYFGNKNYIQTLNVGNELLTKRPDDTALLEMTAESFRQIGNAEKAVENYLKIYENTKDVRYLYQCVSMLFSAGQYALCEENVEKILAHPDALSKKVRINNQYTGTVQEVVVKAAALNVKGMLYIATEQKKQAGKFFEEALVIQPDFSLARLNTEQYKKDK